MSQIIPGFNPATINLKDVVMNGMASDTDTLNQLSEMLGKAAAAGNKSQQYKKTLFPKFDVVTLNVAGAAITNADNAFFTAESAMASVTNVTAGQGNTVPTGQIWLVYGLKWGLFGPSRILNTGTIDRLNFIEAAAGTVTVTLKNDNIVPIYKTPFEALPAVQQYSGYVSNTVINAGPTTGTTISQYVDSLNMSPDALRQNISPEILLGKQSYNVNVHFDNLTQTFVNALKLKLYLDVVIWTAM